MSKMLPSHDQYFTISSPLDDLTIFEKQEKLVALRWGTKHGGYITNFIQDVANQLNAYFAGTLTQFDIPLAPSVTGFQKSIYNIISLIPFGKTKSYGEIAHEAGNIARAVGSACRNNPIPIIVPCHRVLAKNGNLGVYTAPDGLKTKEFLLKHEQKHEEKHDQGCFY